MNTTINKALNLVIPLPRDNGTTLHIHSTPISAEAFEQHWEIISQVWSGLTAGNTARRAHHGSLPR